MIKIPLSKRHPALNAYFSTRDDGNLLRTNESRVEVKRRRTRFLHACAPKRDHVRVRTSHSPNIEIVRFEGSWIDRLVLLKTPRIDTDFEFYRDGADGILTRDKGSAIYLISGDCVPLIVWHEDLEFFGILHVGLLGALNDMVSGLRDVALHCGSSPEKLHAYLGPSISQTDYNVTRSGLWQALVKQIRGSQTVLKEIEPFLAGGSNLDLKGLICAQLIATGLTRENISSYTQSTASAGSPFYSHYAATQNDEEAGAFATLVTIDD